jgi:hypothetical protein
MTIRQRIAAILTAIVFFTGGLVIGSPATAAPVVTAGPVVAHDVGNGLAIPAAGRHATYGNVYGTWNRYVGHYKASSIFHCDYDLFWTTNDGRAGVDGHYHTRAHC